MSALRPEYIKEIMDSIEWPKELEAIPIGMKCLIAMQVQMNLQQARMFDLLRIATGMVEDNDPDDSVANSDRVQTESANTDVDKMISEGLAKGTVCGTCGKGVVPNQMGYCPLCKNDLKKQLAMELQNKPY
jgi:hypothetical protein